MAVEQNQTAAGSLDKTKLQEPTALEQPAQTNVFPIAGVNDQQSFAQPEPKGPLAVGGDVAPVVEQAVEQSIDLPETQPTEIIPEPTPEQKPTTITQPSEQPFAPTPEVKIEQPKITTPKPTVAETVESAEDIKNKQLDIQVKEDAQVTLEQEKALNSFNQAITSGNLDAARQLAIDNPDLKDTFNSQIRATFKNKANVEFFGKFNGATNDEMKSALNDGSMVIGSEQYNLLPEDQRRRFEQFNKLNASTRTEFTSDNENVISLEGITAEMEGLFSFDLRAEMNKARNNPALTSTRNDLEGLQNDISEIDDAIDFLEDDLEKEFPGMPRSFILAEKAKRGRDLMRSKNGLVNQYNSKLGSYQDMKNDLNMDLDIAKFESAQQKEIYTTALNLYEKRRGEMRDDQKLKFLEDNKKLASETQFARQKELATFSQKLRDEGLSGGKYIDDGKGNLAYVKDGKQISVLSGLGEAVGSSEDENYTYQIKTNEDGTYTVFGLPKEGTNVFQKSYGADGEEAASWISSTGTGKITSYGGEHDKFQGLDIDGNVGDPISTPLEGTVVSTESHKAYGTTMVVKLSDGNTVRYSHLDRTFLTPGDKFAKGSILATMGNTGNVLKLDGSKPTAAELAQGFGSHLDLVTTDADGRTRSGKETEQYLNNINTLDGIETTGFVTDTAISTFNNTTFKPQNIKTEEQRREFTSFLQEKDSVMSNKDAEMSDILRFSRGGGNLTDTSIQSLSKFDSALAQLGEIQTQIGDLDTGPVVGKLKGLNPYDTDAQVLKASLTALIPTLARGVYGEVGVLTEADVRLYAKTIPNLESTQETNQAVLGMTLKVLAGGYKRQLQSLAAAGKDVSGFTGIYDNLVGQVDAIETSLGIKDITNNVPTGSFTTNSGYSVDYNQVKNQVKTDTSTYSGYWGS